MDNKVQFIEQYKKIVQELVQIRKSINETQESVADWLGVDRRKIMALESGKIDIELLLMYADKLSIDINLKYEVK